jgi:hypothetical protein
MIAQPVSARHFGGVTVPWSPCCMPMACQSQVEPITQTRWDTKTYRPPSARS